MHTQPTETRQLPLGFKAEIEEMLIFDNQLNQISESFPKTCCNDFDSVDVIVTYGFKQKEMRTSGGSKYHSLIIISKLVVPNQIDKNNNMFSNR